MLAATSSRFILLAVSLVLVGPVRADFHILNCGVAFGVGSQSQSYEEAITVPSNQYDCTGAEDAPIIDGTDGIDREQGSYQFSVQNLCGTNLDFYADDSGAIPFYISGGDGTVQGTCYQGSGEKMSCTGALYEQYCSDDWICYSYICD